MKKSSRVISTLLLGATLTTLSANVFAVESKETIEKKLLAGNNRYETAVKVSEKWEKADNVVLVNALAMADALAATPLAKLKDAPILLTDAGELTKATKERIEKLGAKNVIVVGGEGVISKAVVAELEKAGLKTERISGVDRFETSAKVAEKLDAKKVAVVNGLNGRLADALSVAAPAAENNMAILLTNGKDLGAVKDAAKDKEAVVVGGSAVLADSIKDDLKAERLGGATRNETNAEVMKKFYGDKQVKTVYVAKDGAAQENQLVDALAAGPVAGKEGAPIVLAGSKLADGQKKFLEGQGEVATVYEVGGGINTSTVKDLMTALGVKDVVDKAEVSSVKATNLKEVVVTFGMKVDLDSAEDATNYSINKDVKIEDAVLQEDGRTVVLKIKENDNEKVLSNQEKYKLTVDTVLAGDKEITAKDFEFTPMDNEYPEVKEVKSLGTKAIKIVFSEPVKKITSSNIKLDGKTYYGQIDNNGREVILKQFSSDKLSLGDHKLEIEGVEDYAGFKAIASEHKFTVVEDTTPPTVVKTEATLEKVIVTFSEDVDPDSVSDSSLYYKKDDKKIRANRYRKVDGKTYAFYFEGEEKRLPGYEMTMYIEDVKDYSDNVIKEKEIKVKPEVDQTRPVVRNVSVDETGKIITVKFSKNIHEDSLKDKHFVIKDKDGKVRGINKIEPGTDDNIVVLTLIDKLPAGKNTIKIDGVKDATYLQNVMLPYEKEIDTKNTTKPTCTGIATSEKKRTIILTFDKRMDASTLEKASNYLIRFNNETRGLPSDTEIDVIENGKAVRIILPEKISGDKVIFGGNLNLIEFFGLKDIDGNELAKYKDDMEIKSDENSKAKLDIYKESLSETAEGEAKDRNTIKIKFEQSIGKISKEAFKLEKKVVTENGTSWNDIEIKKVTFEGSYVTITTDEKLPTSVEDFRLSIDKGEMIESAAGLTGVSPESLNRYVELHDSIAPEVKADIKAYTVEGNKILVPFTEELESNPYIVGLYVEDFKVTKIDGTQKVLTPGSDFTTSLTNGNKTVQIEIKVAGEFNYKVELAGNGTEAKRIQDKAGNVAALKDTLPTTTKVTGKTDADKKVEEAVAAINAGTATVEDYTAAGIAGVTDANLTAVKAKVEAAKTTKGSELTKTEIKAEVDAVLVETAQEELADKIEEAKAAKVDVKTSANGDDVQKSEKWVTAGVAKTFDDAIDAAEDKKTSEVLKDLQDAKDTLIEAIKEYNAAKKDGKLE
ncbi:cell wall-binding repeat-containing protein [Clostridium sp. UBA6640]|uniref:cell wall-binding repeat-containing protein n=1 Tax=Clostridium sp. UBA6640 TaxID=1946370 RepID=UPI0025BC9EEE|nr:cell wall-binding repeat-containing protein [Clostridium sp. UBA6640]